jgi:hypothetical protein
VIAETRVDVPTATVSDAVIMLDLRNTNACCSRTRAPAFTTWSIAVAMARLAGSNRLAHNRVHI